MSDDAQADSRGKWAIWAQLVEQQRAALRGTPLVPVPRDRPLPLMLGQQPFWRPPSAGPDTPRGVQQFVFEIEGPFQLEVLERAMSEVVARHESLRTVFLAEGSSPRQRVEPPRPVRLSIEDLEVPDGVSVEHALQARLDRLLEVPFDQQEGSLLRGLVLRVSPARHLFGLVVDHITMDGFSVSVFFNELRALYAAFAAGLPCPLAPLRVQVGDVAVWQHQRYTDDFLAGERDFWRATLGDAPRDVALRLDRPRNDRNTPDRLLFRLDPRLTEALRSPRFDGGIVPTLWAAFIAMLHEESKQEDLVVGTFHVNREHPAMRALIGCFANMLAVRFRVRPGEPLRQLRERTEQALVESYDHLVLPHLRVIEAVGATPRPGRHPLFNVLFQFYSWPDPASVPQSDVRIGHMRLPPLPHRVDLFVAGYMTRWVDFTIDYNAELFDRSTIQRFADRFVAYVEMFVDDVERSLP